MKNLWRRCLAAVTALLMTAGALGIAGLAGAEQVSAAEDTVEVTFNFDYSSLGTQEALAQAGIDLDMPGVTVEVPKGSTVYDAMLKADEQNEDMELVESDAYVTGIYGLGTIDDVMKDLGYDSVPSDYQYAGWTYSVDGESPGVGIDGYSVNDDTEVDFRYLLWYKSDWSGSYDWDFIDAYRANENAIERAEGIDRSEYSQQQLELVDDMLKKAKETGASIDDDSAALTGISGLWIRYFAEKGTTLYGPGSPTEQLESAAEDLDKAVEKKYYEVTGIKAECGDVYVGKKTKIDVVVEPEGAPQDARYEVLFGGAEVTEDGYVKGISAGTAVIRVESAENSLIFTNLTVTVKAAPVYDIVFKSDGKSIDAEYITVKDQAGEVIDPEGDVYRLTEGEYVYEITLNGSERSADKKTGTLVVNKATFEEGVSNDINISCDTAAEENAYDKTGRYMSENLAPGYEDWAFMALSRGRGTSEGEKKAYYEKTLEYIKSIEDTDPYVTEYERIIIALTAAGFDVTDVDGHDLLDELSDMDKITKQGVNAAAYALIALDTHGYDIPASAKSGTQTTRESLIDYILKNSIESGGWNWITTADSADVDMTAIVLQALAPYYDKIPEVKTACDEGIDILSEKLETDGTYTSAYGDKSADSIAEVIVALTSLGIDPDNDVRFVKNGNSLVDGLNSFAAEGGGYIGPDGKSVNERSTRAGYYAMAAYNRYLNGETSLYDMSDVEIRQDNVDAGDIGNNGSVSDDGQETGGQDAAGGSDGESIDGTDPADGTDAADENTEGHGPQTGDVFPMEIMLLAMMLAAIGAVCVVLVRERHFR